MNIQAVKVTDQTDFHVEQMTISSYDDYSAAVEGMIEPVQLRWREVGFTMWVNEEFMYRIDRERINPLAMMVAGMCGRSDLIRQGIWGNVLFTGDADEEGETLDLPEEGRNAVAIALATLALGDGSGLDN